MEIKSVKDSAFRAFGEVVEGYDFSELLQTLKETTDAPDDGVVYVPSDEALERCAVYGQVQDALYGGMPTQIGYCNGTNSVMNCLEYHRGSELNVAADDVVLLVAQRADVTEDFHLDTKKVQAFRLPAGTGVLMYETTMHYAPARPSGSFRVIIGLPRGTNLEKPDIEIRNKEDELLLGRNKWLMAHKDSPDAAEGAYVGLEGENISIADNG